jgi:hypothetical protein
LVETKFVVTPADNEVGPAEAVLYSPQLPAFALSAAVVPLMPFVVDGVIRPVALIAVNAPVPGVVPPMLALIDPLVEFRDVNDPAAAVVPPIAGGDAQILVEQVKPELVVYCRMLDVVEHVGIANAVGEADALVAFARTVFAAIEEIPFTPILPHVGVVPEPVETIACPEVEPAGLMSCTGTVVAASATLAKSARKDAMSFFMSASVISGNARIRLCLTTPE